MAEKDDHDAVAAALFIPVVANRNKKNKSNKMYFDQFCTVYKQAKRKQ